MDQTALNTHPLFLPPCPAASKNLKSIVMVDPVGSYVLLSTLSLLRPVTPNNLSALVAMPKTSFTKTYHLLILVKLHQKLLNDFHLFSTELDILMIWSHDWSDELLSRLLRKVSSSRRIVNAPEVQTTVINIVSKDLLALKLKV